MTHIPTCRTRTEWTGGILVSYSEPDPACQDEAHNAAYTEVSE